VVVRGELVSDLFLATDNEEIVVSKTDRKIEWNVIFCLVFLTFINHVRGHDKGVRPNQAGGPNQTGGT
jgi:hypothetical protein